MSNSIQSDPVNLAAFKELDQHLLPDIVNIIKEYSVLPSYIYYNSKVCIQNKMSGLLKHLNEWVYCEKLFWHFEFRQRSFIY